MYKWSAKEWIQMTSYVFFEYFVDIGIWSRWAKQPVLPTLIIMYDNSTSLPYWDVVIVWVMRVWMTGWLGDRVTAWVTACLSDWLIVWVTDWLCVWDWLTVRVRLPDRSEWLTEWVSKWLAEWVRDCLSEWEDVWVSEWVSDYLS